MKIQVKHINTKAVLRRQQEWCKNKKLPFTYEAFPVWPEKVVYRKMEKLTADGYLEYGVSLRTAWLTDKAKKYLKDHL